MSVIQLSQRQMEILELIHKQAPITGEQIAEQLGVSRPTIRSDLSLLVMLGHINAKPKVGYFPNQSFREEQAGGLKLKVKQVQSMPVIVRKTATVGDAVVALFVDNVGGLVVADEEGMLLGVISPKDLLKVTLGNPAAASMPVSLVMTRRPQLVTVTPDDDVIEAARKMAENQVDMLPVVVPHENGTDTPSLEVVGRISKTTMTKVLLDAARKW
ncbi:helix-turn-helix transcriptional regulator [Paenibacillus sp. UNC499MF]|uniref:helix-turn-helix transcriptional regulator n=1 Tax=Paenibacillus sp. UNC499MF TaxID=1502751 RepID=UPI00089FC288|nr:helix-turn-helix transcriptional regulator [Paenibacillus sp. UNC499MF]SEG35978.1 CBS domain-containing protein [Paenibacillus sp. UNC499MF]